MSDEGQCWCRHCRHELPPGHTGPCPHCGKSGKECHFAATAKVGIRTSVSGRHKPKWGSQSLALFLGILAILTAVTVPGVLMLLPFSPGVNYGVLVGFLAIIGFILWWQRYRLLMLIRRVESKLGGEKKL